MRNIGYNFVECLENYLPSNQLKYNRIGSKVLDIFYEEFVKFVPAYILKREQESQSDVVVAKSPITQTNKDKSSKTLVKRSTSNWSCGFSDIIKINTDQIEIKELEVFINHEYQKHVAYCGESCESSSDDDLANFIPKVHKIPQPSFASRQKMELRSKITHISAAQIKFSNTPKQKLTINDKISFSAITKAVPICEEELKVVRSPSNKVQRRMT
jgi:hypothetical protein